MNRRKTYILGSVKKIIIIVMMGIFLILLCFIFIQYRTMQRDNNDKLIINSFGKQRMYTQMISKDASRLFALLQSQELDYDSGAYDEIYRRILMVKANLSVSRSEFSKTLNQIHNHVLITEEQTLRLESYIITSSEYVNRIDELWINFDEAIEVMLSAKEIDSKVSEAAIYINDNNLELLNQCDNLLNQILADSLKSDKVLHYISYSLILLLIIVISFCLFQLQFYLVQPFSQLYRGLLQVGLNNYPVNPSFPTKKKILPLVTEINDMFLKINSLISLIENMNNNSSFTEILNFISSTFAPFIPYNYIGIGIVSDNKKYLKASYGVSDGTIVGLPEKIRGVSWLMSETSLGTLMESGEARIINDIEEYCKGKPLKLYNKYILEAGIKASITLPLIISGEPMGMIFFSSSSKNVYTKEHLNFLKTIANSIAISINQNIFISDVVYSSILALAKLAEARDEDTGDHLERMSVYSRVIAELLYEKRIYPDEITLEFIDNIERFSPLHDIGKVGIRDGILLKPGKLTMEEFAEMKSHASFGEEVLRSADLNLQKNGRSLFAMGAEIAGGHHEKWDGSGYPYGKKGLEIPLSSRIVAIADVFDALTSKRPYKEAYSIEMSFEIISEGRGKHFDPVIVDVFMENRAKIENVYYKLHNPTDSN